MSKLFDGSDEPLSYGQALCELVQRVAWPSEAHRDEVLRAVQAEHGLLPPEPEPEDVPADQAHAAKLAEIAHERRRLELEAAQRELDELRAKNAPVVSTAPEPVDA